MATANNNPTIPTLHTSLRMYVGPSLLFLFQNELCFFFFCHVMFNVADCLSDFVYVFAFSLFLSVLALVAGSGGFTGRRSSRNRFEWI